MEDNGRGKKQLEDGRGTSPQHFERQIHLTKKMNYEGKG